MDLNTGEYVAVVGVSELTRTKANWEHYLGLAEESRKPVLITYYGKPKAVLLGTRNDIGAFIASKATDFISFIEGRYSS